MQDDVRLPGQGLEHVFGKPQMRDREITTVQHDLVGTEESSRVLWRVVARQIFCRREDLLPAGGTSDSQDYLSHP